MIYIHCVPARPSKRRKARWIFDLPVILKKWEHPAIYILHAIEILSPITLAEGGPNMIPY